MRLLHDKRVKRRNDVIYNIILRFAHGFGERFVAVELGTHEQTADQLPAKITIKVASSKHSVDLSTPADAGHAGLLLRLSSN